MKKTFLITILLLCVFVIAFALFAIYRTPVEFAYQQFSDKIPSQITIKRTEGTLWRGDSDLSVAIPGNDPQLVRASWALAPLPTMLGSRSIELELKADISHAHLDIAYEAGDNPVVALDIKELSTNLLAISRWFNIPALASMLGTVNTQGLRFNIDLNREFLATKQPDKIGSITIAKAKFLQYSLGDILLVPEIKGNNIVLQIRSSEDKWKMELKLVVSRTRQFNLTGKISADTAADVPSWAALFGQTRDATTYIQHAGRF